MKLLLLLLLFSNLLGVDVVKQDYGLEPVEYVLQKNEAKYQILIKYTKDKKHICILCNDGYELLLFDVASGDLVFTMAPLRQVRDFYFDGAILVIAYGSLYGKIGYNLATKRVFTYA